MSSQQEQLPPPLPDQQVLKTYCFIDPVMFGVGLVGMGYIGHAEEIRDFINNGDEQGYEALLITWLSGEYCLIAYYHIGPSVPLINISDDIVIEAYQRARNPGLSGPPVITCRFDKQGATND